MHSIGGLIVLILDLWAIYSILTSSAPAMNRLLWVLLVLVLPIIGFIIWFVAGPKSAN